MKTLEEILARFNREMLEPGDEIFTKKECLKAMAEYADQKVKERESKLLKIIEVYEELEDSSSTYVLNEEPLINQHTEHTYLKLKLELLKKEAGL